MNNPLFLGVSRDTPLRFRELELVFVSEREGSYPKFSDKRDYFISGYRNCQLRPSKIQKDDLRFVTEERSPTAISGGERIIFKISSNVKQLPYPVKLSLDTKHCSSQTLAPLTNIESLSDLSKQNNFSSINFSELHNVPLLQSAHLKSSM